MIFALPVKHGRISLDRRQFIHTLDASTFQRMQILDNSGGLGIAVELELNLVFYDRLYEVVSSYDRCLSYTI